MFFLELLQTQVYVPYKKVLMTATKQKRNLIPGRNLIYDINYKMASMQSIIAYFFTPAAIILLLLILFPYTPLLIRQKINALTHYEIGRMGSLRLKLILTIITILGICFVAKLIDVQNKNPEGESLSVDKKMMQHRAERDLFLYGIAFFSWIYVWRLGVIMEEYATMKAE